MKYRRRDWVFELMLGLLWLLVLSIFFGACSLLVASVLQLRT